MSTEPVGQSARARREDQTAVAIPVPVGAAAPDECLEFVRFCYRRRRVSWPTLYDEMAAVAARGAFRGLSFAELAERGVCFSLGDLPRLAALTEKVILEERGVGLAQREGREQPAGREQSGGFALAHARG